LPLWERVYFLIHHSIFIQIILTTAIVSAILIFLHIKYRKTYIDKYEELIRQSENVDFEKKLAEDKKTCEEGLNNQKAEGKTITIENEKFGQFLKVLNTTFNC
jgi:regulatory protein YycI of two-component signal transduction system YycFG